MAQNNYYAMIQEIRTRSEYSSNFVTDDDLVSMFNASVAKLSGIAQLFDTSHFVSSVDITIVSGTSEYSMLDADAYATSILDVKYNGEILDRINWKDRLNIDLDLYDLNSLENTYYYNYRGGSVWLFPEPTATGTLTVTYIPEAFQFVPPTTNVWSAPIIWKEWVLYDTLVKCAKKAEDNFAPFREEQQSLEAIIRATPSDTGAVSTIGSTRRRGRRNSWGY